MGQEINSLIIFVKNPELGKVKTRLAADVGNDRALEIYHALLDKTRKVALTIEATRYLFYSQFIDDRDDWQSSLFVKSLQKGDELGARMTNAFSAVLAKHPKAIIIGSDCPQIEKKIINYAFALLDTNDFVIGPALDGGYYLLGMKFPHSYLFQNMTWSVDTVFEETTRRILSRGHTFATLPTLSDIDYLEDWEKYGWDL